MIHVEVIYVGDTASVRMSAEDARMLFGDASRFVVTEGAHPRAGWAEAIRDAATDVPKEDLWAEVNEDDQKMVEEMIRYAEKRGGR